MALSGSRTVKLDSRGQVQLISEWSATQDKIAGTSTITVKNYLRFAYAIYATATQTGSASIGGQSGSYSYSIGNHPNGVRKLIGTVTKTVAHNSVGDLTTTISTSNPVRVTYAGQYIGNADMSYTITLDKIARNSTLTALSNANIPSGSPTFTIAATNSAFTHIVDFRMNGKTLFSRTGLKGGNHNFNLTTAEKNMILKEMANVVTSAFTVVLGTYSGSTFIGVASSRSATINIDASVKPTISNIEFRDGEMYDPEGYNYFYDLSTLKVETSATPGSYATLKSIEVIYNGATYRGADILTSVITQAYDASKFTVKVTDSRNRVETTTRDIPSVIVFPSANVFWKAFRVKNGDQTPEDNGDRLFIEYSVFLTRYPGRIFTISIEKDDNTWQELVRGHNEQNWNEFQVPGLVLDVNKSYRLRLIANTMIAQSIYYITIPTGFTTIDFRTDGRGLAIGKVSEKQAFEVAFPMEVGTGGIKNDGSLVVGGSSSFSGGINSISVNGRDMNTITETGFYQGYSMTNAAVQSISTFIVNKYSPDWIDQIQIITGASPQLYIRSRHSGTTWGGWSRVLSTANTADYVIERGSNSNGSWEKWNSGKLVQTMTKTLVLNSDGWQYIPLPQNFVGAYSVDGSLVAEPTSGTGVAWYDNMHKFTFVRFDSTKCAALIRGANVVGSGWSDVVATGRWK